MEGRLTVELLASIVGREGAEVIHKKMTEECIVTVGDAVTLRRSTVWPALQLPLGLKAKYESWIDSTFPRPPVVDGLCAIAERNEKRKIFSYLVDRERAETERGDSQKSSWEEVTHTFASQAKNQMLTTSEVLAGQYIIFGDASTHKIYVTLITTKKGQDRIRAHNWFVAEKKGEAFIRQHGAVIQDLEYPLFPALDLTVPQDIRRTFDDINERIFSEHRRAEGAGNTSRLRSFYAPDEVTGGEPYLPVHKLPDGSLGADGAAVLEAVNQLRLTDEQLKQQIGNLQRVQAMRQTVRQDKSKSSDNYNQRTYKKEQGWRGRGRGRGGRPRGGGSEEQDTVEEMLNEATTTGEKSQETKNASSSAQSTKRF